MDHSFHRPEFQLLFIKSIFTKLTPVNNNFINKVITTTLLSKISTAFTYLLLFLTSYSANSAWELNMVESATAIGREIHGLHMTIFYICVVIAIVVFGIMLYSIIRHRKSLGAEAKPFHESTLVEIIWTTIPLLILVAMAIPATQTLMAMYDTDSSDIDIKVTGYQWKWRYEYLNTEVDFFSTLTTTQDQMQGVEDKSENYLLEVDNHLVIPINKKVRFLFTAQDVIHSWWVPEL